jgi:hypothetical protein
MKDDVKAPGSKGRKSDSAPATVSPSGISLGLTMRGVVLAVILNVVYTMINAYLGLNFGFGLGFGIITVLAGYTLFKAGKRGTTRQEIATTMVASTGFAIYYPLSIAIYIQANIPDANLPWWLVPPYEVVNRVSGTPFHPAWIAPILFELGLVLAASMLGFIVAVAVHDLVLSRKKATFPFYLASGVAINACLDSGRRSRFLFRWLGIGVLVTFIQYLVHALVQPGGLSAVDWDFTPFLPTGFALGFVLNISLMAVSFIIDPKVSITMLFAGIATYLALAPLLTAFGWVTPGATGMEVYFNLLFQFTLSPALGIMLLSSLTLLVVTKLRARHNPSTNAIAPGVPSGDSDTLGFGEYTRGFFAGLTKSPRLTVAYAAVVAFFIALAVGLNVFFPFPAWLSITLALVLLIPIALIDVFVMLKFVGEAGFGIGAQRLAFYEIPLATIGASGYPPFLAYPAINPFTSADVVGNLKIADLTSTPKRAILLSQILKIVPGSITSVVFVLGSWYLIGFPSEIYPGVGVLQGFAIVTIFATRAVGTGFNLVTFFLGGTVAGLLAAFTAVAPLGIALAMFLPPNYFIPFSFGGFLRLYTQRRYGKQWFGERGQVIAVGFIAGSAITQVIVSFLPATLQLLILPVGILLLTVILVGWGRETAQSQKGKPAEGSIRSRQPTIQE